MGVVRRAVHGPPGVGAGVPDHWKQGLPRLHGPRVVYHVEASLRSGRALVLPRRELSAQDRSQRQKDLLVAREWMGDGRTGARPRGDAGGLSHAAKVHRAIPADGGESSFATGSGWPVASRAAGWR